MGLHYSIETMFYLMYLDCKIGYLKVISSNNFSLAWLWRLHQRWSTICSQYYQMNIILAFSGIWGTQYCLPVSILKSWLPNLHDLVKGDKRKRQITMLSWPKDSNENANYTSLHLILQSEKLSQNFPTEMKSSKWPAKEKQ